jgi:hypothetical protein
VIFRGIVCGICLAAAAHAPAFAQTPPPQVPPKPAPGPVPAKPEAPAFVWFNELGDTVVAKCDLIVLGKVSSIKELVGGAVVRVTVSTWFFGDHAADQTDVTLLSHADDFFLGNELLLFLTKFESGPRFTYLNRILKSDPDFDAKRKVLEQTLELQKLKEEERRRQVRKLIYDGADARDAWTRWHALTDLHHALTNHPGLVTLEDRADLRALAKRSGDAKFQKALLAELTEKEKSP